jgi:hypothetical protein
MYLQSIKSVKQKAAKFVNRSTDRKADIWFGPWFGVFMVHSSMREPIPTLNCPFQPWVDHLEHKASIQFRTHSPYSFVHGDMKDCRTTHCIIFCACIFFIQTLTFSHFLVNWQSIHTLRFVLFNGFYGVQWFYFFLDKKEHTEANLKYRIKNS